MSEESDIEMDDEGVIEQDYDGPNRWEMKM
jgi:hypothetical protein